MALRAHHLFTVDEYEAMWDAGYRYVRTVGGDGTVSPLAFSDLVIAVRDVVPPR